jgi:hypothetical protein
LSNWRSFSDQPDAGVASDIERLKQMIRDNPQWPIPCERSSINQSLKLFGLLGDKRNRRVPSSELKAAKAVVIQNITQSPQQQKITEVNPSRRCVHPGQFDGWR